ncbi:hypothetical protein CEXT_396971 [Caerostris extrusa]|uniref:Uncharacterized protein n=1 Tax=Caerostris extrusa TaxID=172846 RepID=A0AAV4QBJ3_CAEEX|nr:hypothetical protein CEXT_396971 [Caerostris extrusa]
MTRRWGDMLSKIPVIVISSVNKIRLCPFHARMGHHVCSSEVGFIIRHYMIIPTGNHSNDDFVPDGSYDEEQNVGLASWHEMVQYTTYGMILVQYIPFRTR